MSSVAELVEAHYGEAGLWQRVREALRQSGLDPDRLKESDLEGGDQFHVGGLNATDALIRLAGIQPGDRVLDLGCGIGGPSRHLASTLGCRVTGLDLTDEYCQIAASLARSTGLSHLVDYQRGNALAPPFADQTFDVVWTQHAAMNIEDKDTLYRGIFRLLKNGGRLALHDVVAGSGELLFPVPWASSPAFSFLISEDVLRRTLTASGFEIVFVQDESAAGLEAIRRLASKPTSPGFGLRTILRPDYPRMFSNLAANLQSGACRVIQLLAAR